MRFAIFPIHLSKLLRLPRKLMPGHTKCCTCHARSSQQTWRSDLQNATPLRKSAPGPPNSSDEHVSCTAPATENASLQILLKFPTPAIVFWKCYRTLITFCSLLTRSTIPCACHAKWHLVLLTFDKVHNPLRLPRQMTSEPPKVVRTWCVLYILTSTCASRHNGVQFFISHLARWLRTRRFSEPTFRPSGASKHWKNTVFRRFATFLPFRAPTSSFFWLFLFSDLLSSTLLFSDSSHLCF